MINERATKQNGCLRSRADLGLIARTMMARIRRISLSLESRWALIFRNVTASQVQLTLL